MATSAQIGGGTRATSGEPLRIPAKMWRSSKSMMAERARQISRPEAPARCRILSRCVSTLRKFLYRPNSWRGSAPGGRVSRAFAFASIFSSSVIFPHSLGPTAHRSKPGRVRAAGRQAVESKD